MYMFYIYTYTQAYTHTHTHTHTCMLLGRAKNFEIPPKFRKRCLEKICMLVRDFIFLGFKITVDGDCSHEIKRCLLRGRKGMTNLDSILKNRDITLQQRFI